MPKPIMTITGLEDAKRILGEIAPRHAANLNRAVVHGIAGQAAKEIKQVMPSSFKKRLGNVFKSVKAKRRRGKPDQPESDVIFTMDGKAKNDGFYWRFLEHGTRSMSGEPFVGPVREAIFARLPQIYEEQFGKKFEALLKRERKKKMKK